MTITDAGLQTDVIDVTPRDLSAVDPPPTGLAPVGPMFPQAQQRVTMLRTFVDLAARIAGTEFVPKALRGKPAAVLACILTGYEMGIGPMQSLAHIHIVDGKATQSAELMRSQIMRAGHRFSVREKTNEKVTVFGKRADTAEELTITWTMEDARRALLVKSGGAWVTYPRAMLMARATSELARDLFADVLGGIGYTPEELGAEVVVTEGGYIDVAEHDAPVGLPSGEVLDPTAAWDRVNAMKPREVMEELKARGLPAAGSVDALRGALAEALAGSMGPAEAPQDAPTPPEAESAPDAADPASDAPTAAQDAPESDEDRAARINMEVAAMSDKDVLANLEARMFIDQADFPDGIPGEANDQRRMLAMLLFTDAEPAAIVEAIEEKAATARAARRA